MLSGKFKKNYIREVLFRLDFRTIPELINDNASLDKFIYIIKNEFNIVDETFDANLWAYFSQDYSKRIELTPTSIVISYDGEKYESHDLISDDIRLLIEILDAYDIKTINKIGLRYINEIMPNIAIENWDDWINPNLHNFKTVDDDLTIIRSLTQSELKIREYTLNFIYGQFNLNYPDPEIENDFVLDYDCYTSSMTDILNLHNKFEEMHEIIISLFLKCIEKNLIKDLNEEL